MKSEPPYVAITDVDLKDLTRAKSLLENTSLTARLANVVGAPIEKGFALLPKGWSETVHQATQTALTRALEVAVKTLRADRRRGSSEFFHKIAVGASGGIGGAFGLPALFLELPVSTTIMLRSIADIARDEGHNLSDVQVRLACLEVFALGGRSQNDDANDSAYWAVRAALTKAVSEAAAYFAQRGVFEGGAPAIVRLIAAISSRFGVIVSEQLAAKAVPVVGAAGGSIVNVLFMKHFQDMARGHFIVKRLERKYGVDLVQEVYGTIAIPVS